MDTKTALGAAGGISLTVVGAVSALVLTLGAGTSFLDGSPDQPSTTVVEYVDQHGNPVDLQTSAVAPKIIVANVPVVDTNTEIMVAAQDPMTYAEAQEPEGEGYAEHEEDDEHEEEDDD